MFAGSLLATNVPDQVWPDRIDGALLCCVGATAGRDFKASSTRR
jgi:hypothetical protein